MNILFRITPNVFLFVAILFFAAAFTVLPFQASAIQGETAQDARTLTSEFAQEAGFNPSTSQASVGEVVALVISVFLSILGIIFLVLVIVAGYNWMTAGGNEEKVEKAKKTLTRAVIGLAIILAAYSITYVVFKYLGLAASGEGARYFMD
jgi:hypothetical protein